MRIWFGYTQAESYRRQGELESFEIIRDGNFVPGRGMVTHQSFRGNFFLLVQVLYLTVRHVGLGSEQPWALTIRVGYSFFCVVSKEMVVVLLSAILGSRLRATGVCS